jgi:hypothetical protein
MSIRNILTLMRQILTGQSISGVKYRAQITFNGKGGSNNNPTKQLSHEDVLPQIREYVGENSDAVDWIKVVNTSSLPWPCTQKNRLLMPDLIYCKPDRSMKFGHSITNVIEFESETSAASIANKVERFNESSRRMIEDGAQSGGVLPFYMTGRRGFRWRRSGGLFRLWVQSILMGLLWSIMIREGSGLGGGLDAI